MEIKTYKGNSYKKSVSTTRGTNKDVCRVAETASSNENNLYNPCLPHDN